MSNKNIAGKFAGKGYYIALILCAFTIGISGYLYYQNANRQEPSLDGSDIVDVLNPGSSGTTAPSGTQGTKPTQPKPQPLQTMQPVEGTVAVDYAMDCLCYNPTTRDWRVHDGVDIAAAAGTEVKAAADGQVYTVYKDDAMGTTVVIRHEEGYITVYASLGEEVAVGAGDQVTLGQTIGTVGETALLENALGEHLHFAVLCNDEQMDPAEFLNMAS